MNILLIISVLVFVAYAILIIYYSIAWRQVPTFDPTVNTHETKISVIVPARNEAKSLPHLLHSLTRQAYFKDFEVIVIDDFSTDDTAAIASSFPFVTCLQMKDFVADGGINSYKKKAIEIGIANSTGDLIVTTDADCVAHRDWLKTIASFYEFHKPALVVMPVAIDCSMKAIEIFQALDFMTLQGITAASVHKKIHSMCNGANLAYTREAFDVVNGFAGIDKIASGDDMLLMHKIAKKYPGDVHYLKSKNVIVQTEPVHSIKEFFNQRIRWASKADKYDDKRIFVVLLLVYVFNVLMLLLPIWSLVNGQWSLLCNWWILLVAKTVIEMIFLIPVARFFNKSPLLWFFPVVQPFHILYTVIAGWLGKFGNYTWKERKVK